MTQMTFANTKSGEITVGSIQFTGKDHRGCLRPRFRFYPKRENTVVFNLEQNQTKIFENTTTEEEKKQNRERMSLIMLNREKQAWGCLEIEEDEVKVEVKVKHECEDDGVFTKCHCFDNCECNLYSRYDRQCSCVCVCRSNDDNYDDDEDDDDVVYVLDKDWDGRTCPYHTGCCCIPEEDEEVEFEEFEFEEFEDEEVEFDDFLDFAYFPADDSAEGIKWRLHEERCEALERMECRMEGRRY